MTRVRELPRILVSPCCHAGFDDGGEGEVVCLRCGQAFPRVGETVDLVPAEYREDRRVRAWSEVHRRYVDRNRETATTDSARRTTYVAYHREFLRDFCSLRGRVLDVGCGPMLEHLDFLQSEDLRGVEYLGVDPEASFVSDGSGVGRLFRGVGEYLPFAAESVDTVLMISVLDHVIMPDRVLAEVRRVLRPDGRFFQSLPMREITWRSRVKELLGARRERRHVNEFNEARLLKGLDRAGLRVERKRSSTRSPRNLFVEVRPRS